MRTARQIIPQKVMKRIAEALKIIKIVFAEIKMKFRYLRRKRKPP